MARFTSKNAVEHGQRDGQLSRQRIEEQYANVVRFNPPAAELLAHLIHQGHRFVRALCVITLSDRVNEGGR